MTEYQTTLAAETPLVITIGNFDGIHLGHQRLLHMVQSLAEDLNCTPALITFAPHTLAVIRPEIELHTLTTMDEKLELARRYGGINDSIIIHFTPEMAALSASDFMDRLCSRFTIRGIVIGSDFSLGHNRTGNVAFLEEYGRKRNIQVRAIMLEENDHTRISSTRIRALISDGKVEEAGKLLGHPFLLGGNVVHGSERGRQLGFPTANMEFDPHKQVPANGVYAVRVKVYTDSTRDKILHSPVYNGVTNIGIRPTFDGKERLVEVHILNTNLELYQSYIQIEFISYLRGEQRFSGVEALKTQISTDVQKAQEILANRRVSH